MPPIDVETMSAEIKPPAVDDNMRTSTGGRCGFGVSAPLLIRASSMPFSGVFKSGSAIMPKLVKLVGPSLTLAEQLSPFFARSAAASSVHLRVLLYVFTSASVAKCCC